MPSHVSNLSFFQPEETNNNFEIAFQVMPQLVFYNCDKKTFMALHFDQVVLILKQPYKNIFSSIYYAQEFKHSDWVKMVRWLDAANLKACEKIKAQNSS